MVVRARRRAGALRWVGGGAINLREGEILKLVVDGFIRHATPISSLYLTQHYDVGVSSATVRSIFAGLESEGYLFSPHRSAGRIPTERAYRYYVNNLGQLSFVGDDEQRFIQAQYLKRDFKMEDLLQATSQILSRLTRAAAVVVGPAREKAVLKHLELIDMGADEVLLILVTRTGGVYSRNLFLENRIPSDYLRHISRLLSERCKGAEVGAVPDLLRVSSDSVRDRAGDYEHVVGAAIARSFEGGSIGNEPIYLHGLDYLYNRIKRERAGPNARPGQLFESENVLRTLFAQFRDADGVEVLIEGDRDERLQGLSVVSASYKMGEQNIGALGVVGPNRMNYARVIGRIEYVRRLISNMITRMSN